MDIPIHAYVLEHPDGLIVIDTGLHAEAPIPRPIRPLIYVGPIEPSEEIGPPEDLASDQQEVAAFVREVPTMLLPAHDPTAAARLAAALREPVSV